MVWVEAQLPLKKAVGQAGGGSEKEKDQAWEGYFFVYDVFFRKRS